MCVNNPEGEALAKDISNLLDTLVKDSKAIAPRDLLIYIPDRLGTKLEPTFASSRLRDALKDTVAVHVAQVDSGLVSDVFTYKEPKISRTPSGDPRIGRHAQLVRESLGLTNSLIAWPLYSIAADTTGSPPNPHVPLAVLLVNLNTTFEGPEDPHGWKELLSIERLRLGELVAQFEAVGYRSLATRYNELIRLFLDANRPGQTPRRLFDSFAAFLQKSFGLDQHFILYQPASHIPIPQNETLCTNLPLRSDALNETLPTLIDCFLDLNRPSISSETHSSSFALNYHDQAPDIYQLLNEGISTIHVWAIVRLTGTASQRLYCVLGRPKLANGDKWSDPDFALTEVAARLLSFLLQQLCEHSLLINYFPQPESPEAIIPKDVGASHLELLRYIAEATLGLDQLMLCAISRNKFGWNIYGLEAKGFGQLSDSLLKLKTQRFLSNEDLSQLIEGEWDELSDRGESHGPKIDVLAYILRDQLWRLFPTSSPKRPSVRVDAGENGCVQVYVVYHENVYKHFTLQPKLANDVNIKGPVCFIPCYEESELMSSGSPLLDSKLRCILMLASSRGANIFTHCETDADGGRVDYAIPLLADLSKQAAHVVSATRRRQSNARLSTLRSLSSVDQSNIQELAGLACEVTGGTCSSVYVRAPLLSVLGGGVSEDRLTDLVERYLLDLRNYFKGIDKADRAGSAHTKSLN